MAARARVSEASIFYHYGDRAGLLQAVFAEGLRPFEALHDRGLDTPDPSDVLERSLTRSSTSLIRTLPVIMAAQADVELRDALAAYMSENDLGPHRGVRRSRNFSPRSSGPGVSPATSTSRRPP